VPGVVEVNKNLKQVALLEADGKKYSPNPGESFAFFIIA
jgi:hypothetical protein